MIELVRRGRTPEELARQFEPSAQAIRNWVKQAALDAGQRTDGLTTEERDEVRRLRREVRQLREERAILSKAAAWFARETNHPSNALVPVRSARRGPSSSVSHAGASRAPILWGGIPSSRIFVASQASMGSRPAMYVR